MKIRFTETYTVKAVDGPTFQKGSVHDLREDSAQHFINRRVAVIEPETVPAKAEDLIKPIKKAKSTGL